MGYKGRWEGKEVSSGYGLEVAEGRGLIRQAWRYKNGSQGERSKGVGLCVCAFVRSLVRRKCGVQVYIRNCIAFRLI